MNRPRARSAGVVVRRLAIPADLPVGVEATAAELARVSNERARLLRELTALDTRRQAARDRLVRLDRRLRDLMDHFGAAIEPPPVATIPAALAKPPAAMGRRPARS